MNDVAFDQVQQTNGGRHFGAGVDGLSHSLYAFRTEYPAGHKATKWTMPLGVWPINPTDGVQLFTHWTAHGIQLEPHDRELAGASLLRQINGTIVDNG